MSQDEVGTLMCAVKPDLTLGEHEKSVPLLPQGLRRVVEQCGISTHLRKRLHLHDGRRAIGVVGRKVGRIEAPFWQCDTKRLVANVDD